MGTAADVAGGVRLLARVWSDVHVFGCKRNFDFVFSSAALLWCKHGEGQARCSLTVLLLCVSPPTPTSAPMLTPTQRPLQGQWSQPFLFAVLGNPRVTEGASCSAAASLAEWVDKLEAVRPRVKFVMIVGHSTAAFPGTAGYEVRGQHP